MRAWEATEDGPSLHRETVYLEEMQPVVAACVKSVMLCQSFWKALCGEM